MATRSVQVRVTPRSARTEVTEQPDGSLHVRTTAPPADGKANKAVAEAVARHLGVPKSAVTIAKGATSRNKLLHVTVPD